MLSRVRTTGTLSFQAWLGADARALGRRSDGDLQGGDPGSLSTYADMTHLLAAERRSREAGVRHIAYFCGPLHDEHAVDSHRTSQSVIERFLETGGARSAWPAAYGDGAFDWNLLVDPENRVGSARLDAQYIRENVHGTERYTLTVRGSTACRLPPDGSGVFGLYLAGDWVKNGLDVGCIEGAVRAGEACAAAIATVPLREASAPAQRSVAAAPVADALS
jgi:hypothetical protein